MSLAKGLSILFIFSKNQLLVSLIFSTVFSISFISALIFMISFRLLTFWVLFVLIPLIALDIRDRLCCLGGLRFFLFPEVRLYCYKLPSLNCLCYVPQILDHCVFIFMSLGIFFPFLFDIFSDPLVV